jgi:hypothetical protein
MGLNLATELLCFKDMSKRGIVVLIQFLSAVEHWFGGACIEFLKEGAQRLNPRPIKGIRQRS